MKRDLPRDRITSKQKHNIQAFFQRQQYNRADSHSQIAHDCDTYGNTSTAITRGRAFRQKKNVISLILSQSDAVQLLKIGLHVRCRLNAECLDEQIENCGRDKFRKRRSEHYVLHTQMQENKKDKNRFLLIPCDIIGNMIFS